MSRMTIAMAAADGPESGHRSRFSSLFKPARAACSLGFLLVVAIGMTGCSDDNVTVPPDELAPPTNVRAANQDQQIVLRWAASPDEGSNDFDHYNIYRGTTSLMNVEGSELEELGYKIGSVGADVDSFTTTVANGTLYFFHVRAQKENGNLSETSNEVQASARAEGSGRILEEFAAEGESGFDFSTGTPVALSQDNASRFTLTDIYLGTAAADDASTSVLSLKSPELLTRLNTEWATRMATIKFLGTDWAASTTTTTGFSMQADVVAGAVYAVRTPGGNYAKLKVETISGTAGSRTITFRYAYQSTPNLIQF